MSFRISRLVGAVLAGVFVPSLVSPVLASVAQCPLNPEGHRLRMSDGASLYVGDPGNNGLQAPDATRPGRNGPVNVWTFRGASNITLVCRYDAVRDPVALWLPSDIQACRQDINARTFVCQ